MDPKRFVEINEEKREEIVREKITPNQIYDVITSKKPEWQSIIYDLIHSEQLDPWDINLIVLTNKYFEKIFQLEQDPDFYVSSKVLLAAALLLRIKSEFLLNRYVKSIDEVLFGKKAVEKKVSEEIVLDESELPFLIPKTPMARLRKITLPELLEALDKAIHTETRRIKRELAIKRAHRLSKVDIPQFRRIDIKDRIREFYTRVLTAIRREKDLEKVTYSSLAGLERDQKIACFLPLLHLSNSRKLWLEQEKHLDEIYIYLYRYFEENKEKFLAGLEEDIDELKTELASLSEDETELSGLEKARETLHEKRKMQEEITKELTDELGLVDELTKAVIDRELKENQGDISE